MKIPFEYKSTLVPGADMYSNRPNATVQDGSLAQVQGD